MHVLPSPSRLAAITLFTLVAASSAGAQTCPHIGTRPVPPQAYPIGDLPCVSAALSVRGLSVTPTNARCPVAVEVVPLHWEQTARQGWRIRSYAPVPKVLYGFECRQHSFLIFTTGMSCALVQGPTNTGHVPSYLAERCSDVPPIPSGAPPTFATR